MMKIFSALILLLLLFVIVGCKNQLAVESAPTVPMAPLEKVTTSPTVQQLLEQYPDDLDVALEELDEIE